VKTNQLLVNLKKCDFSQQSLVYLGYVIGGGGGELKIDLVNMEVIIKWPTPTNVTKIKSFMGEIWYLQKFIVSISTVAIPLCAITISVLRP